MATGTQSVRERFRPRRETIQLGAMVLSLEIGVLLAYLLLVQPAYTSLLEMRRLGYPFVWINVGLWAIWRTDPAPTTTRRRYLAGALAVGYFAVLAYAGGLATLSGPMSFGPRLATSLPPGYSPTLLYAGPLVHLTVFPYKLVGYLALTYLVYATVIDAAGSAVSGVLGLLSCVSCTWPVVASIATGVFGGASAVAAASMGYAYGISTVVFVVTVGLLYWRPTVR